MNQGVPYLSYFLGCSCFFSLFIYNYVMSKQFTKLFYPFIVFLLLLLLSFIFLVFTKPPETKSAATTYTVTNTDDSGVGSLRQAILNSNSNGGQDTIEFAIGGGGLQTISPTSMLPAITDPAILDGESQTGFTGTPLIEINGTSAGSVPGIWITAGGTTIKGFIINRFTANGIFITNSSGNIITGNYIGTNSAGTSALANGTDGVGIYNSSNHTIGGTTAAERNIISGNTGNGVGITDDVPGDNPGGATGNVIKGNYIGTNTAGTGAIPNGGDGILINNAGSNITGGTTGTTPGGACTGECNLISGNGYNGFGIWYQNATGNQLIGNYIGTNAAGTGAIPNANIGAEINEASANTFGGTTAAARNIMSGNLGSGVFLTGADGTNNVVQGNYIGTNSAGTAAIGNAKMGVGIGYSPGIQSASGNTIGGTTGVTVGGACTGACNLISGNGWDGIFITNNTSGGGNIIKGNYIGTTASGSGSIGNHYNGIGILDVPNNTIGGPTNAERNIISASADNGVIVASGGSTGNRIEGNYIGLTTTGSGMGNTKFGIQVDAGADTAILGNSIYANGDMGIDLGYNRVTYNDPQDNDNGPNRLQNFPKVFAETVSGTTRAYGTLNSTPSTSFRLDFFSSDSCNAGAPLNYGEGQVYIGNTTVGTDVFGNVTYSAVLPTMAPGGKFVTSTATKLIGSTPAETSEFSECTQINAGKPAVVYGSTWFLRDNLVPAGADNTFGYGFPAYHLMCAWDSNQPGLKLPVIFSGNTWFMRGSHTTGGADNTFSYGPLGSKPVCGDWNGDGTETIGVVDGTSSWYLRNSNNNGAADLAFQYGPYGSTPVVGDWNGNGTDTIGTFLNGGWSLRNNNSSGPEEIAFAYGFAAKPVPGDWNGDGTDTPGIVTGTTWLLRNNNSSGPAEINMQYGFPGADPVSWR